MKRRVMIAKALSHEPDVLFLDEPTAGVDVNLRRDMWALVRKLRDKGVTIILTTHYIEEAEEMADRVGVIDKGRILLVEDKAALMHKFGKRRLTLTLRQPMDELPAALAEWTLELDESGRRLTYCFDADSQGAGIPVLLRRLGELRRRLQGSRDVVEHFGRHLHQSRGARGVSDGMAFNPVGIWAIYRAELARTVRTSARASPCR